MAASPLNSYISVLFSELSGIVSVAGDLCPEAAAAVVGDLSSQLQELSAQLATDEDISAYVDTAPSHHPSSPDSDTFLDVCRRQVRETLQACVRRVAENEPESLRITRVTGLLDYVQRHIREHMASVHRSSASTSPTAASPAVTAPPTALALTAPLHALSAHDAAHASALRPPQFYTSAIDARRSVPPLVLHTSQIAVVPWTTRLSPPPFTPSHTSHDDDEDLQLRQTLLENENTIHSLHARATGGNRWSKASDRITELVFLKDSLDVATAGIPTAKMLFEAAPNLSRLSINVPIAPSIPETGLAPDLCFLLVDEGNRAMWSPNRTADTLDALYASDIRELVVQNAWPATLRKCLGYLARSTRCVIVDDGDTRFIKLVDRRHSHTYSGTLLASTRVVYKNKTLEAVATLTLNDRMVKVELDELFERAFPRRLKELRVWYGAEYRPQESRQLLLEYRSAGWGRCEGLERLILTTRRPVDLNRLRGETPAPTVRRSLIRTFLLHIHGGNLTAMLNVKIIQDGVNMLES